ncbi:MAG: hypothetical protein F6K54_32805 [Okeania sp. SIO3B5]|uniref:hypothetical protein n=1 Tax=Okeania sp. SIO3B5 TaxID=2607811 RepID=UPI0013FF311E|nr:hypothetical protein [Okeania sp. SIO3B5]NEO57436.1 hypothetical protein [Okeania sp. SIO3B5]
MGRWGDGEMGRWGDWGIGSVGEIKKYISSTITMQDYLRHSALVCGAFRNEKEISTPTKPSTGDFYPELLKADS